MNERITEAVYSLYAISAAAGFGIYGTNEAEAEALIADDLDNVIALLRDGKSLLERMHWKQMPAPIIPPSSDQQPASPY